MNGHTTPVEQKDTKKYCKSKFNIFITFKENLDTQELKRIMKEYGTVKSINIKR